jgi:hypothetical protein
LFAHVHSGKPAEARKASVVLMFVLHVPSRMVRLTRPYDTSVLSWYSSALQLA